MIRYAVGIHQSLDMENVYLHSEPNSVPCTMAEVALSSALDLCQLYLSFWLYTAISEARVGKANLQAMPRQPLQVNQSKTQDGCRQLVHNTKLIAVA
jgi:hypothetical protein